MLRDQKYQALGAAKMESTLSTKITTLLSSSYSDLDLRDALHTLETTHKITKNSPATRRNLRLNVQREILDSNSAILDDFGQVAEQLKSVGDALAQLQSHCASLRSHVSAARVETAPMLDEASSLLEQKERTETKQGLLDAFNAHFILSSEEQSILTAPSEPVDANFFTTLVKAKRIQLDSQILLSSENQRLGLEILDSTRRTLDGAFQKLFRWTQKEFRALDLENPSVSANVRRALRVLAEKPNLFQSCLDHFAEAREITLRDAFYTALTGGAGGQPIDFSAHEPLRYAGDMLAWAHSTTVSEREALESLFVTDGQEIARSIQEGLESEPWLRADLANDEGEMDTSEQETVARQAFDGRRALAQLIDRSLSGVLSLLQSRISTLASTHTDASLAYKLANLTIFYRSIFTKLVLPDAALSATLSALTSACLSRFQTLTADAVAVVRTESADGLPADDLDPPDFLEEALGALPDLLKSYDTHASLADSTDGKDGEGAQLLLRVALDPYLEICRELSTDLAPPNGDVFAINSLLACKAALSAFPGPAREKLAQIDGALGDLQAQLTGQQLTYLLASSGLQALLAIIAGAKSADDETDKARGSKLYSLESLGRVQEQLDAFLPVAVMDARERLSGCVSRSLVQSVTERAAERFCEEFEKVEGVVQALGEGREEVWVRSAEEVRVLLS